MIISTLCSLYHKKCTIFKQKYQYLCSRVYGTLDQKWAWPKDFPHTTLNPSTKISGYDPDVGVIFLDLFHSNLGGYISLCDFLSPLLSDIRLLLSKCNFGTWMMRHIYICNQTFMTNRGGRTSIVSLTLLLLLTVCVRGKNEIEWFKAISTMWLRKVALP